MKSLLLLALLLPLVSTVALGLLSFLRSSQYIIEKRTYKIVLFLFSSSLINNIILFFLFLKGDLKEYHFEIVKILIKNIYHFDITVYFDMFSSGYLLCATIITNLIVYYSHRYLHNDPGYQRFFIIISLFFFGLNLVILSGGLNTIFAGWEVIGLSSFLLISYFWHRPKAAIQAQVAYNVYRVTDIGLLASVFISHFLWHGSHLFVEINEAHEALASIPISWRWLLSLSILLPVLGKSAQFPFCFWLPKAMEGPTHSSAIFYGSLSIHAGVFLLIRTMPIWQSTPGMTLVIFFIGLITALLATLCAQVQSNIKGQIGYASIAQVGVMLILLSLNFPKIAFLHMIGNAFLRTFQLLVSGSILTTHLELQGGVKKFSQLSRFSWPRIFSKKIQANLFVLAINEGYLEPIIKLYLIRPIILVADKITALFYLRSSIGMDGSKLKEIKLNMQMLPAILLFFATSWALFLQIVDFLNAIFLITAILLALLSLGEKYSAKRSVTFACLSYFFCLFSTIVLSWQTSHGSLVYLTGFMGSALFSLQLIGYMEKHRRIDSIHNFNGLYQQFPRVSGLLLLGFLGIVGFPLCSTFIGEEILLHMNKHHGIFFMIIFHFIFMINGISLLRLYSYIFFGKRNNIIEGVEMDLSAKSSFLLLNLFVLINVASLLAA